MTDTTDTTMVIELARFRIHEGAEEALLAERPGMIKALRERFPGCLAAYLTKENGGWLDVVLWRSRDDTEEAARQITSVPACAEWLRHIQGSSTVQHVEVRDAWSGAVPPSSE
jgi:quinol monooxygenase YgiN